ncbi:MAG: hypothetical protein GF364_17090 [Candidatus Lokiarchaeota archaeon]|nr:hypothetical protein [Candidatus Lokiarchaeota archaeon]
MVRETWSDVLAYYLNYVTNLQPVFEQTQRFILDLKPESLLNREIFEDKLKRENKRSVSKVKAISEFLAMFRTEIFEFIWNYVEETKDYFDLIDIQDYIIDFLIESIKALKTLESITNPDEDDLRKTLLYQSVHIIQEKIFPQGQSLQDIYDKLIDQSISYYEVQRHLLKPAAYYREDLEKSEIPGFTPNTYKILNQITSLFNLDPNYYEMPEDNAIDIPVILPEQVFDPFIEQIANKERTAITRILKRMELRIIDGIFIGPTERFLELTEPHNYITRKSVSEDKERIIPQFSNETLVLLYLAKTSYRRGFLSRELINWISSNIAFLIYKGILKVIVSDDNIFYPIFVDLKVEEKILPYLMKLACFENYLRMDRTKIRDSVQYRKQIFNSLGSKNEYIESIIKDIAEALHPLIENLNI